MSIIEVEALAKTFKTRERAAGLSGSLHSFIAPRYRQREAVKPISFSLEPGELLAFIGPNGAGNGRSLSCHNFFASPRDCAKYNEQDGNNIDTDYRNGERPQT
jgi:energy-coupling factor transporter ATP-binding protein EcfA2